MIINLIVLKWNHCHSAACRCGGWCLSRVDPQLLLNYIFHRPESLSPSNNCGRRQFHLSKPNIWHQPCRLNSLKIGKHSIFHHFITIFFPFLSMSYCLLYLWSSRQRKHRVFLDDGTYITQKVYPWSMRSVMWWFWTCPVRANALVVVKRLKMPLSLK